MSEEDTRLFVMTIKPNRKVVFDLKFMPKVLFVNEGCQRLSFISAINFAWIWETSKSTSLNTL